MTTIPLLEDIMRHFHPVVYTLGVTLLASYGAAAGQNVIGGGRSNFELGMHDRTSMTAMDILFAPQLILTQPIDMVTAGVVPSSASIRLANFSIGNFPAHASAD